MLLPFPAFHFLSIPHWLLPELARGSGSPRNQGFCLRFRPALPLAAVGELVAMGTAVAPR